VESLAIEPKTVTSRAYELLVRLIGEGQIGLGDRLDERALASEMGISRTPLREAIGMLATEGVVEYRPYQGNFARVFTAKQVDDLYEVRKTLESLAIRLAAARMSDESLERVRAIVGDIDQAIAARDIAALGAHDRRFHETIAELSDNRTLIEALDRIGLQVQLIRSAANRDPQVIERTELERHDILAALERRDGERAAALMEQHIEGVKHAAVRQFGGDA